MRLLLAAFLLVPALALAHSFTEYWSAPTEYTDGTAIPAGTAITYNLYVGTAGHGSESSTPAQNAIRYLSAVYSTNLVAGEDVCATVTAVINGVESAHSNESCSVIPGSTPKAPLVTKSSAT